MQNKKYAADPRMSQSKLKHIFDGVEAFKDNLENPMEQTPSMRIGSAFHILVLEPHRRNVLACLPKIDGKTREGKILKFLKEGRDLSFFRLSTNKAKKQGPDFYEVDLQEAGFAEGLVAAYGNLFKNPEDYLFLSEDELETAEAMAAAVMANSTARGYIEDCIAFEEPGEYTHKGIDFKCCYDGLGFDFCLDLKSTILAPSLFTRKNKAEFLKNELRKLFYHFQGASYLKGCKRDKYIVIFCRNVRPFQVFPRILSPEFLEEGAELFDEACDLLNDCFENNPQFIADNKLEMI